MTNFALLCTQNKLTCVNLIIDIGNTMAKIAVFDAGNPVEVCYDSNQNLEHLRQLTANYPVKRGITSSVVELTDGLREQIESCGVPMLYFDSQVPVPVTNRYATPQSLGADRLAAVVAAHSLMPDREVLVIDAGTCITYELVDADGNYWGGNISPGMNMRFKALHAFTGKLPLVEQEGGCPELGCSTETAIRAGVKQGIIWEIEGYITHWQNKYPRLGVCLTGGDDFPLNCDDKIAVVTDKMLVLKGLDRILEFNNDTIQ